MNGLAVSCRGKQCGGMEAIWTELESYLHPLPHFISVGSYLTFSSTVSLCKAATEPGSPQMPKKNILIAICGHWKSLCREPGSLVTLTHALHLFLLQLFPDSQMTNTHNWF